MIYSRKYYDANTSSKDESLAIGSAEAAKLPSAFIAACATYLSELWSLHRSRCEEDIGRLDPLLG